MANSNHIEAPQPTNHGDSAHPSERLLNTASDLFRAAGMGGSAKALDTMNQLGHTAYDSIDKMNNLLGTKNFGIDGIDNKAKPTQQGIASKESVKSTGENKEPISAAEAEALRFGQGDGDAREHVGYSPTQLASKTTDKVKVPDHVSPENTLMTARISASLSQTERTRLAAQIEKKQSAEKSKAKRERSKIGKGSSDKAGIKPIKAKVNTSYL